MVKLSAKNSKRKNLVESLKADEESTPSKKLKVSKKKALPVENDESSGENDEIDDLELGNEGSSEENEEVDSDENENGDDDGSIEEDEEQSKKKHSLKTIIKKKTATYNKVNKSLVDLEDSTEQLKAINIQLKNLEVELAQATQKKLKILRKIKLSLEREGIQGTNGVESNTSDGSPKRFGQKPNSTVYVSNIPAEVTEDELKEHFAKVGEIENIGLPKDPKTNTHKGFAFVKYQEVESATKACELNETTLKDNQLTVKMAKPKTPHYKGFPNQFPGGNFRGFNPFYGLPYGANFGFKKFPGQSPMNRGPRTFRPKFQKGGPRKNIQK